MIEFPLVSDRQATEADRTHWPGDLMPVYFDHDESFAKIATAATRRVGLFGRQGELNKRLVMLAY
jgi:hypothetical protein